MTAPFNSAAHVQQRILQALDSLTPMQTQIARSILASYPGSATRSSAAIARSSGTSSASVTRFVQRLGFATVREFQEAVRSDLDERFRSPWLRNESPSEDSALETVIQAEAANISETLRRLSPGMLAGLRELLLGASTVSTLGGRFSYALAVYLSAHLRLVRPHVTVLTAADIADQLAHAGRGTCLVVFDFRRYQPEAEAAARYVKSRRGRVIVITDPYLSPASHHADRVLVAEIEAPRLVDSYAAVVALLDTIVSDLASAGGKRTRGRIERVEEARRLIATTTDPHGAG
jgi:DNA-binding MurR/RpiR family transcriptional regulator